MSEAEMILPIKKDKPQLAQEYFNAKTAFVLYVIEASFEGALHVIAI